MTESVPAALVTVSVTSYVPGLYVWLGLCSVDVAPSPNAHDQVATLPVDASVNATSRGPVPFVGAPLKTAVGATGQTVPAQPWRYVRVVDVLGLEDDP